MKKKKKKKKQAEFFFEGMIKTQQSCCRPRINTFHDSFTVIGYTGKNTQQQFEMNYGR